VIPFLSSSRTRSLMRTLASIAMPSVRAIAAMPGSVSVACSIDRSAMRNSRFAQSASVEKHPEQRVVDDDEERQGGEAVFRRVEALLDVFGAERGTDGTLLDDFHRRGERPRAQQQRHVVCLDGGHPALICTRRRRIFVRITGAVTTSPLPFFDEQDRHALANVLAVYS